MHHKTLIFLTLVLNSCSIDPPHVKAGNAFITKFAEEVSANYDLLLWGSGGAFLDDIKGFGFDFISFEALTVDEARQLAVDVYENLINQVNRDCSLQPYLHPMSFDSKNVKLAISFRKINQPDHYVDPPNVALIYISNNKIWYDALNPHTEDFSDLYEESYEQAKDIVEHQIGFLHR